ncbi:MAG: PilN domain-containing protein [Steroidobacteraceae bacterium]|jgi:type IV pilus assembly protein PilN|nr:PilN domain-containing protein [Steroidobacteraceae bacterium]
MPRINLLPWREAQRKERKLAFLVSLGAAGVAALVATFAFNLYYNSLIDGQEARNERLRAEIRELDKQIEQINDLEQQKQNFIARMEVIEKLQRSRPEIVHVFDELVRTLPDGAYLTGVKQTNNRLKIDGVAQSSTRVSTFMRNIDSSQWLRNPELDIVETKANQPLGANFTLFADQVSVAAEDAKVAAEGKGKKAKGKDDAKGKRARQASAEGATP